MTPDFLDFKVIDIADPSEVLQKCSGNSERGVFIGYLEKDRALKPFLEKIFSAVHLDIQKEVLVLEKTPDLPVSFSRLSFPKPIQKALLFGIPPSEIGLQINSTPYQPISFLNTQFLFADDLEIIHKSQPLKKQLWEALQQMFTTK